MNLKVILVINNKNDTIYNGNFADGINIVEGTFEVS